MQFIQLGYDGLNLCNLHVLTQARDYTELFSRPQSDRVVVRDGVALREAAPSYAELDGLEGLGR